jgi:NitT/TauT family transport system substrate-binding protein
VRTASDHVPFYVAARHQLYKQQGLDVTVRVVGSNTEIVEALQRGDFQVGVVPVTTAIAAIAQGSRARIVAMTGRGGDGVLVRQEGPTTLAALRGKRVGTIRASILEVLLRTALAQEGLDAARDVEVVFLTTLGDLLTALKTGQLEAVSCTEPFLTAAEHEGWGRVLARYTTAWPDHPCCVVLAADAWAARSPDALRGVLAVHCQATDWSNEHPDEAAHIIVDTLQTFSPAMVRASLNPIHMRVDYHFAPDEIERMAHLMVEQGLISQVPPRDRMMNSAPLDGVLRERR